MRGGIIHKETVRFGDLRKGEHDDGERSFSAALLAVSPWLGD